MSYLEIALLIVLVTLPITLPLMVFVCVKLGTGAFFSTRERFYNDFGERKRQNGDHSGKA